MIEIPDIAVRFVLAAMMIIGLGFSLDALLRR